MSLDIKSLLALIIALIFIIILTFLSKKNVDLGYRNIIATLLGIILGNIFPGKMSYVSPIGRIYVNFITAIVVPLLFTSVICSIFSLNNTTKLKKIGGKSVFWLILNTIIASILGLIFSIATNLGKGLIIDLPSDYNIKEVPKFTDIIVDLFPKNIISDASNNKIINIIIFTVLIGISVLYVSSEDDEKAQPFKNLVFSFQSIINKAILILVSFTPYAVLSLIASSISNSNISKLIPLLSVLIMSYIICTIHLFIVNGALLIIFAKVNPIKFFKKMSTAMITAFTSQSSIGTLPITLNGLKKLGISDSISSFTAPLGTTIGMPACSGIWPITLAIVAINSLNIEYSLAQYILLIIVISLVSIGTIGAPGTSTITATAVFSAVGLPVEIIIITTPISMIVDMIRTATNVTSAAACTVLVAKSENEINMDIYNN